MNKTVIKEFITAATRLKAAADKVREALSDIEKDQELARLGVGDSNSVAVEAIKVWAERIAQGYKIPTDGLLADTQTHPDSLTPAWLQPKSKQPWNWAVLDRMACKEME